jgi:hypothetical protein
MDDHWVHYLRQSPQHNVSQNPACRLQDISYKTRRIAAEQTRLPSSFLLLRLTARRTIPDAHQSSPPYRSDQASNEELPYPDRLADRQAYVLLDKTKAAGCDPSGVVSLARPGVRVFD